jgi:hypothetical protein
MFIIKPLIQHSNLCGYQFKIILYDPCGLRFRFGRLDFFLGHHFQEIIHQSSSDNIVTNYDDPDDAYVFMIFSFSFLTN